MKKVIAAVVFMLLVAVFAQFNIQKEIYNDLETTESEV